MYQINSLIFVCGHFNLRIFLYPLTQKFSHESLWRLTYTLICCYKFEKFLHQQQWIISFIHVVAASSKTCNIQPLQNYYIARWTAFTKDRNCELILVLTHCLPVFNTVRLKFINFISLGTNSNPYILRCIGQHVSNKLTCHLVLEERFIFTFYTVFHSNSAFNVTSYSYCSAVFFARSCPCQTTLLQNSHLNSPYF